MSAEGQQVLVQTEDAPEEEYPYRTWRALITKRARGTCERCHRIRNNRGGDLRLWPRVMRFTQEGGKFVLSNGKNLCATCFGKLMKLRRVIRREGHFIWMLERYRQELRDGEKITPYSHKDAELLEVVLDVANPRAGGPLDTFADRCTSGDRDKALVLLSELGLYHCMTLVREREQWDKWNKT